MIKEINWLAGEELMEKPLMAKVRLRSTQEEMPAKIIFDIKEKTAKIELLEPINSITAGQACVIYDDAQLLGGGWIY